MSTTYLVGFQAQISAMLNRIPVSPVYPDFHLCDRIYGENLYLSDCKQAVANLLYHNFNTGSSASVTRPSSAFPIVSHYGDCYVSIELAGPTSPDAVSLSAPQIANWAVWVMSECVTRLNGQGGFVTASISRLMNYAAVPTVDLTDPYPAETFFITLTLSEHSPNMQPGDNDPAIAEALSSYNLALNRNKNTHNSPAALKSDENIEAWNDQAARMGRGETTPWWELPDAADDNDEMSYECDPNLGSPAEVDCTQIEWNQLSPASSDTLSVGPETTTFLHSNTCYLAISSARNLVLTWSQIRTAVSTLMNVCIQPPYGSPQGGRAFYRTPQHVGRGQQKPRRRDGSVTGWNALPQGAEITVFQQAEPWTSPATELQSCTWKAVVNSQPVTACH